MREKLFHFLKPAGIGVGLVIMQLLLAGCEIRPKPFVHLVEYQSRTTCERTASNLCPWTELEQEAEFSALVNCLLTGANVLEIKEDGREENQTRSLVVAPLRPRYGYERRYNGTAERSCSSEQTTCSVASQYDRPITWASCGARPVADFEMRGGEDEARADKLSQTDVLTGTLAKATDNYQLPNGLDGPDHWYQLTINEPTRMEVAVAANRAMWSGLAGLVQSAWQPALYLLSSDKVPVQQGYVLRAGVTALFPFELSPGTYYLVVDSSAQEWTRGDGLYRLYVGFNRTLMGAPLEEGEKRKPD